MPGRTRRAGSGSFDERMSHLMDEVGVGSIVARCEVNQPYAQDQHETPYRHRVGMPQYLRIPLMENAFDLVEDISRRVITPTGSDLDDAMSDVAEKMVGFVAEFAPLDTGQLRTSGHPTVSDNGVLSYDRPPISPRDLTAEVPDGT